jgi:uncharacterized protein (DUF1330 family)
MPSLKTLLKTSLYAVTILGGALTITGTTLAHDPAPAAPNEAEARPGFTLEMKRGEVLQVIASENRPDGGAARRTYGQSAFPIASSFGFQRLGQLNVSQNVISDFAPEAFSFFSWPDQTSVDAFGNHPDWPAIKATRPDAWSELKVYTAELQDDLTLHFDPDKHYSLVVAWLKDDGSEDYARYLSGIEAAVTREGGRFIYKMREPSLESHASPPTAPNQLTFVEWDDTEGFARVQQSPEYQAHSQYFGTSVKRFEFYWMQTPR